MQHNDTGWGAEDGQNQNEVPCQEAAWMPCKERKWGVMRDPGPARSGPALLSALAEHSLQITENRAELPAISSSTQSRHLLSLLNFTLLLFKQKEHRHSTLADIVFWLSFSLNCFHSKSTRPKKASFISVQKQMLTFCLSFCFTPSLFRLVHFSVCLPSRRGLCCLPVRSPFPQRHEVISCAALSFAC